MAVTNKVQHSEIDFRDGFNVTPSDSSNLVADVANTPGYTYANALLITATGNLSFVTPTNLTITMTAVPVGTYIVVAALQVKSSGTTASVAALIR